jgi:hypothetical protein
MFTIRCISINFYTFFYPSNINRFNNSFASSALTYIISRNFLTVIRCFKYLNVFSFFFYNIFVVSPFLRRNPFPYVIYRVIVLNGVCDPSVNYIRYSSLNRSTILIIIFFGSSGWSSKIYFNINIRSHHINLVS